MTEAINQAVGCHYFSPGPRLHPQNYAAFSHGNLAVDTLSKLVSTLQDCANALSQVKCETANTFLSRNKFLECLPSLFTYCWQTTCKSQDSFINWTCGKLSTSSLVRFLKQKLFWSSVEGFKIASCVVPKTRYIHSIAHSRWWPLFLFNHLRTVLVEALLRDTCNARRICRSVWQQSVALFNELWEQKITSCARDDRICPDPLLPPSHAAEETQRGSTFPRRIRSHADRYSSTAALRVEAALSKAAW